MGFKEEVINHYLDPDLQVSKDRDPGRWTSGNGLLYTGLFYTILGLRGELNQYDFVRFSKATDDCFVVPGLLCRNPGRPDHEAQDDYIGITAASFFLKTPHAKEICDYGSKNCWSFDNTRPNKFSFDSWHYRFPGLVGFYRLCAGFSPGWLQALSLGSSIFANAVSSKADVSGKILTWLQVQVAKACNQYNCKDAIKFWEKRLQNDFGSISTVFALYFGTDHPFSSCGL